MRNNCEHFATFCKKGKAYSNQVEEIVTGAATIGVGVGLVAAVGSAIAYGLGTRASSDKKNDDD